MGDVYLFIMNEFLVDRNITLVCTSQPSKDDKSRVKDNDSCYD